ncbi:HesA/MoeB/ThiF family protein [Candidatus Mycolicibacterium alkanivorans]|uniref:HesA/MoeB/ThiF family protein n=1 Tax=Candidatus Mycolicibacterium alkanivorans TaxID=2954114 RepID=A0ABS9YTB2_9MYCO|nr:HesA/MoeB/ThiF family protein [Candidatus Mycolicibacterium alkanivorans]MCI4673629.1 HesA/MoeB/ThiF family protein [Candidatus Mycolicibacterium alkanivorans]
MLTTTSLTERFDRQLSIPGFGLDQQHRLGAATALIAGIGGVGGATATYLAAAGIGRLILVHPGMLEEPDLNRQTLMVPTWLGAPRVDCAARTLGIHYPDVEVEAYPWDVDDPRLPGLVADCDIVVDARHNFPERYLLNRMCALAGVPRVVAAMNATEGYVLTIEAGSPCLRCVFPEGDPAWQPLGFPVLGAVAGTAGCLAAMEAVKVVARFGESTASRLTHFDLWDMDFRTLPTRLDPHCPDCGGPQ